MIRVLQSQIFGDLVLVIDVPVFRTSDFWEGSIDGQQLSAFQICEERLSGIHRFARVEGWWYGRVGKEKNQFR